MHAAAGEGGRDLHPEVLALIYGEEWFRLLVPGRWGGRSLPLPQLVRLEEGLAFADGSVGWTVTLCSGAGWFAGFFPPEVFGQLFSDQRLCIAGSGSATGVARVIDGGYRVSGHWAYASGALHATAFTANCVVWEGEAPVVGDDGNPVIRPFLFLRDEVRVHADWNAMGLVATGSHGFSVEGLLVGAERCFVIDAAAATDGHALYRYPFLPLAEATLAANLSGMAQHFLDCCAAVFAQRVRDGRVPSGVAAEMERVLGLGRLDLYAAREAFYLAVDRSWEMVEASVAGLVSAAGAPLPEGAGGTPLPAVFAEVGLVSHALAAAVREWVDRLYPYAGLGAARMDSEINRVWRDLHTAGQHPLLVA
ncbi:flavin-dependent monooxygenase [Puia dinghuensis]|uniref:Flavin-dependent monooxygenase n=2 Tax=Puia dinghuensis TaxID=1792502 RepID=A0A8J2U639_9BACT|nr:flavin-dependent monooxygenase [Puia dinghuensis]